MAIGLADPVHGPDTAELLARISAINCREKWIKSICIIFRSTLGDVLNLYILKYGYIKMASIP